MQMRGGRAMQLSLHALLRDAKKRPVIKNGTKATHLWNQEVENAIQAKKLCLRPGSKLKLNIVCIGNKHRTSQLKS